MLSFRRSYSWHTVVGLGLLLTDCSTMGSDCSTTQRVMARGKSNMHITQQKLDSTKRV